MVLTITVPIIVNAKEDEKSKLEKRTEERVKRLRALGHSMNYVSGQDEFHPVVPIAFTE